ncbi:MAG: LAGLIDADG family homing endonuclease [Ktedonobacteraceae bacterium]
MLEQQAQDTPGSQKQTKLEGIRQKVFMDRYSLKDANGQPLEFSPEHLWARVARGIAAVEKTPEQQALWEKRFYEALTDFQFVPGGRILAGAGSGHEVTYFNCMPPDQEVLTTDGYRPISEIKIGDLVVTHLNRLRPVVHKFERETEETLYIIRPKKMGYDDLRVTGDHKVYIIRSEWVNKHRSRDGLRLEHEPEWIPAKEIKPGDYVAIAHNSEECLPETISLQDYITGYETQDGKIFKATTRGDHGYVSSWGTHHKIQDRLVLDGDLCYLLGRWLGDGCVTHRAGTDIPSGIKIVFSLDEKEEAQEILRIIEAKFGIDGSITLSSTERWYDLWASSMALGEFFKAFLGCYSYGKRIPDQLMHLPAELTLELLRGLFSADGYVSDNKLGIVLSNRALTVQIHQLLLRMGYLFSIRENTHRLGRVPAYRIQATANECAPLFEKFFGVQAPEHSIDLKYYFEYDDLKWVRVSEIAVEDYAGMVLDIEVEDDHSFISAGIVVSNCYVIPSPEDSRQGILDNLKTMTEIMARGGGVGINLSTLRPRGSYIKTVNGTASGPCSWAQLYSVATGDVIQQGGCFGPDERIATDHGLIPAKELAARLDAGEVLQARTHKGFRPFNYVFHNGIKDLYEVTTRRGYKVRVTLDHKMGVLREGNIATIPLRELKEGDEILLLLGDGNDCNELPVALSTSPYNRSKMSTTLNEKVTLPTHLTADLAYLLGFFYGDGYVRQGKKVTWRAAKGITVTVENSRPDIQNRLVSLLKTLFSIEPVINPGDGACTNITAYSRLLVEWLQENGLLKEKAAAIRVPEVIFRSPASVVGAFLGGYFDADGCDRGKKGGYGFDCVSREMLEDIQQLLIAYGIVSHITVQDRTIQGWQPLYRLLITGAQFKERFSSLISCYKDQQRQGLRSHSSNYPMAVWHTLDIPGRYYQGLFDVTKPRVSHYALTRIRERVVATAGGVAMAERLDALLGILPDVITSVKFVGPSGVYDFEVDDVHLLSVGGIYTSNSRRGALMLMLDDNHPDVEEFITVKRKAGKIEHANLSVCISDKFMEAVKNDDKWDLVWQGEVKKTIRARELWDLICTSAWESAEPGMVFMDRCNKESNTWYYEDIRCVNPCVTGDTLIYTDQGLIPAAELAESRLPITVVSQDIAVKELTLAGNVPGAAQTTATSSTTKMRQASHVFPTGVKPVFRLQTQEGYTVRLTGDHKILTIKGWKAAQDLAKGDTIHLLHGEGGFGTGGSSNLGQVLGWLVGDGYLNKQRQPDKSCVTLSFFGSEQKLASHFAEIVNSLVGAPEVNQRSREYHVGVQKIGGREESRVESVRLMRLIDPELLANKLQVPPSVLRGSREMQKGFLAALFSADGSMQGTQQKGFSVRLTSISQELLEGVQRLLLNFGIASCIARNRRIPASRHLPDGKGGLAAYDCKAYHDLIISSANLQPFAGQIGFLVQEKLQKLEVALQTFSRGPYRENFLATFESLTPDGEEVVYDLSEPEMHLFSGNGLILHNCGEQPLPPYGVCNLGALNLAAFVQDGEMDWERLAEQSKTAMRFLDNVVDANGYFIKENEEAQLGTRRTGLGTMGLADALIKMKIPYGSQQSVPVIERIYATIRDGAYEASADIAAEKGPFPKFERDKYLKGQFIKRLPRSVQEKIKKQGIRNAVLLTQAPTGTTSLFAGVSSGIEPVYDFAMVRRDRTGEHILYHPLLQEWRDAHPTETTPPYFVASNDLTPEEHVRVQATIQRYTDASISKTVNAPNGHTVEAVQTLYRLAYEMGCKGITYYRDGSRDAVLTRVEDEKKAEQQQAQQAPMIEPVMSIQDGIKPIPAVLQGYTRHVSAPEGKVNITINSDDNGPFEVFVNVGKAGSDIAALAEALGRLISLNLRILSPLSQADRAKVIAEQLRGIGGSRSVGFGSQQVRSLPDAVARSLELHLAGLVDTQQAEEQSLPPAETHDDGLGSANGKDGGTLADGVAPLSLSRLSVTGNLCPECGCNTMVYEEGCKKCYSCGHSEC